MSGAYSGNTSNPYELAFRDYLDENEDYETLLGDTWAPYSVVAGTASDVETQQRVSTINSSLPSLPHAQN